MAQFYAIARQENHELTELLQNYWRCRRQLTQSHTQLHTQSSECKSTQNRLWSFRDEQLTLQVGALKPSRIYSTSLDRFLESLITLVRLSDVLS